MKKAMLDRKITNRLRGITADEDRRLFDIQHRVWYGRWEHFADFLLTKPTDSAILKYAHGLIDGINGYGYARIASNSNESLEQVIVDKQLK